MKNAKPTYEEMAKKLAEMEKLVARLEKDKATIAKSKRDISTKDTQELAEAYIASEQNFKNSIDASPMGIRIVTEDGKLIYANKAILDMCGYSTAEELASVPNSQLYTPESYKAYQERKKRRKLNEYVPQEYEISIMRPGGEVRILQVYRREVIWGGEQQFMAIYQDITERKRAQEALKESEEKFHSIVEHSNDGIVFVQDGKIQYCNSKMLEIVGHSEAELLGRSFLDFIAPEHKEMILDNYSLRMAGKKAQERYEANLVGKSGRKIYVEISASVISFKQAQVDIGIIRDITERKKAEEALADEAIRRRLLIEQSRDGIVVLDQDGKVFESNQRFADMLGYTMDEMKQIHVFDWEFLFPKEQVVEMIRTVDEKGDHFETQHRRKDGTIYDVEISTNGAMFRGKKLIFCVCRDITERKRVEATIEESEERFRTMFETMAQGVIYRDSKGKVISVNSAAQKILGLTLDQMLGKTSLDPQARQLHENGTAFANEDNPSALALRTGKPVNDVIMAVYNPVEEDYRWIIINATPEFKEGEKKPFRVYTTFTDITERKKAEDALKHSEERLKESQKLGKIGSWEYDVDTKTISWSDETYVLYERDPKDGPPSVEEEARYYPPEQAKILRNYTAKAIAAKQAFSYDLEVNLPSGRKAHYYAIMQPVQDEQGKVVKLSGTVQDITERKQMEETVRESEEKFSKAFASTPAIISITTLKDGRYVEVNDTFLQTTGNTREEVIGKTTLSMNVWVDLKDRERMFQIIKEQGQVNKEEFKFRMKSGEIRTWLFSAEPITLGGEKCLIGVSVDITERKKAEETLRESEREKATILNGVSELVTYQDRELKIIWANKAASESVGISPEKLVGRHCYEVWQNRSEPCIGCPLTESFATGQSHQAEMTSPDGRIWFVRGYPILDEKGSVIGATEITLEITERKKAEEALKESQAMFFTAFHSSPTMMTISTLKDGKIIAANDVYCHVTGYSRKELIDHSTIDLRIYQNPDDRKHLVESLKNKDSVSNVNVDFRTKKGEIRAVDVSLAKIIIKNEPCIITIAIDITDRKRAEEALRESEERFRRIFQQGPMGIMLSGLDYEIKNINDQFCKMLGYSEQELRSLTFRDFTFPEDIAVIEQNCQKLVKGQLTHFKWEKRAIRKNKGIIWENLTITLLRDKSGEPLGFLSMIEDITERKKTEEAIKESEEKFNKAFHASLSLMAIVTLNEGRIIDVNEAYCNSTGYKREELIGHTSLELNLWAVREQREVFYQEIVSGGRLENEEILLRTKKGEIRVYLLSAEKIMLYGTPNIVIVGLDITERKKAEQRIEYLNQTLRSIRNVNQLITRENDRDKLLQGVCDILVESRSFFTVWIGLLDESHRLGIHTVSGPDTNLPAMAKAFKEGSLPQCVQKALKKSQVVTTTDPQIECAGCPILTDSINHGSMTVRLEYAGNIYGILCAYLPKEILIDKDEVSLFQEVATDIAFALYNIELQSEYERMEQETQRADKLESIGTLAGGIAHDFNNLLTGIVGNIGLVKTNTSPNDAMYEMLDEAENAALRARTLTQQLLTFARGGKPVKKPVDIDKIIKESATFALRGSKAKLELRIPDDLWLIEADEGQLSQVINNLVINADEAMPTGGTIKIKAENLTIKKAAELFLPSGNYIHISITDTGIGISPTHLPKIFEPYFTTKQKGSGLGLPTAYSIVRNHGGTILAESKQNKGSTFQIYLPAIRKAMKGGKQLTVESSGQAGGKVLIMDDEEIIRKMLKNMLSLAGYIVELSADGAEALEKYQKAQKARDPFNAVIMDLTIPGGMGGRETIKKLLEIDPNATAIVSSGYATDPIMSEYKKYGFKAVIAKPYSIKQLQETLSGLLTKRKR